MRRVASLYLPFLPIDRIRRIEGKNDGRRNRPSPIGRGRGPAEGWEGEGEAEYPSSSPSRPTAPGGPLPLLEGEGEFACSCPRGGHWRPGARWAKREELEAQIEWLPAHQRPTIRELGRRSEAAEMPFKRMKPDEGGPCSPVPKTGGQALVTVHHCGQRVVLAAACRDARMLGLMPGMPLTQVRAMVPGLEVRHADPDGDVALLQRIGRFAARRITPLVAPAGHDGLWLDLTGAAHLHGGERQVCAGLLRFCAKLGLEARIAVTSNGAAADALARHGSERLALCAAGEEAETIAPLPIAALRIDQSIVDAMRRLGLERIGDLVAIPRGPLVRRYGRDVLLKLDQALGHAAEPFDPIVPRDAPSVMLRFAEPIGGAESIAQVIGDLLDQLIERLGEAGLGARALLLLCDRVDKQQQRVEVGAARATRDKAHLLRLLGRRIETIDPGFGIDAMRLIAACTEPLGATAVPGDLAAPEPVAELSQLIDLIAGRIGAQRLYRLSAIESDVPERSVRKVAPLDLPVPWPDAWPRPPRLLPRPEPIDHVVAELPDAPPRRFSWRGRTYTLVRGDGPERIYGEWWKRGAERDAVRDYFRVEDEGGARFWLFRRGDGHDPRTGDLSWWIHGGCG